MQLKVLAVDDEPLAREGLKLLLGRQPQVGSISEARNGREAIVQIREQNRTWCFSMCRCHELTALRSSTPLEQSACRR